ncbi:MAG: LysM peptidoglycan-binding domain-containing protein [Verrucomicrobiota bacterium]
MAGSQAEAASHLVRSGETFTSIARLHGISITTLQRLNPKVKPHFILKGQSLVIPDAPARRIVAKTSANVGKSSADSRKFSKSISSPLAGVKPEVRKSTPSKAPRKNTDNAVPKPRASGAIASYKVRKGDTLILIADKKGLSVKQLMAMNRLSDSHLSIGQSLLVPATGIPDGNTVDLSPPTPRPRSQSQSSPSKPATPDRPPGQKESAPKQKELPPPPPGTYYHIVRKNQDFSSIAAANGVSWAQLARANRRVSPDSLQVNQRLIVPATQVASRAGTGRNANSRNTPARERSSPARTPVREREAPVLADTGKSSSPRASEAENSGSSRQRARSHAVDATTLTHSAPARLPIVESEDPLPPVDQSESAPAATPMTAYKVAGGETIDTIAREFATTPEELRRMNNMNNFDNPIPNGYVFVPWAAPVIKE